MRNLNKAQSHPMPFELAGVQEIIGPCTEFKDWINKRSGIVAFAYLCPSPAQQSYEVSINPLWIQEILSRIYVCTNKVLSELNLIVTPNIKKHLEKDAANKVHQ